MAKPRSKAAQGYCHGVPWEGAVRWGLADRKLIRQGAGDLTHGRARRAAGLGTVRSWTTMWSHWQSQIAPQGAVKMRYSNQLPTSGVGRQVLSTFG